MPKSSGVRVNGVSVGGIKKMLAKGGKGAEDKFLSKLSESDIKAYRTIASTTWVDVEVLTRIFEAAAKTLYRYDPDPLNKLFYELTEQSYSGIYSIFLLFPKRSYLIKHIANIWNAFQERGVATAENLTKTSGDIVVRDYEGFTEFLQKSVTCHIDVLLRKTGSKKNIIEFDDSTPGTLIWHIQWSRRK